VPRTGSRPVGRDPARREQVGSDRRRPELAGMELYGALGPLHFLQARCSNRWRLAGSRAANTQCGLVANTSCSATRRVCEKCCICFELARTALLKKCIFRRLGAQTAAAGPLIPTSVWWLSLFVP